MLNVACSIGLAQVDQPFNSDYVYGPRLKQWNSTVMKLISIVFGARASDGWVVSIRRHH